MLALLPVEILASITALVNGRTVQRLWETGYPLLHRQLANGGVLTYEDVWQGFTAVPVWPKNVLIHLSHLTTLSVSLGTFKLKIPILGLSLADLPPTLTRLELENMNECFSQLLLDADAQNNLTAPTALRDRFPVLQSLSITAINADWLSGAPESLLRLKISTPIFPQVPLPENLTELEIGGITSENLNPPPLPLSLVTLRLKSRIADLSVFAPLPTSLRYLHIADTDTSSILHLLPPDLEELRFDLSMAVVGPKEIEKLPRSLRSLWLDGQLWGDPKLRASNITHLPPNLETLLISVQTGVRFELLPRTLTKLTLTHVDVGGPLLIPHLPAGLLYLSLPRIQDINDVLLSLLPLKLRTFKAPHSFRITQMELLPRTLRSLRLHHIADAKIAALPPQLTELRLEEWSFQNSTLSWAGVCKLPDTLTELRLSELHLADADFAQFKWPKQLKTLGLGLGSTISDGAISRLPRGLVSLTIPASPGLTGACFALLPRHLCELVVTSPFDFTGADLIHLPRSLVSLEFWNDELTEECAQHLPPLLYEVFLHCNLFTEATLRQHLQFVETIRIFHSRRSSS